MHTPCRVALFALFVSLITSSYYYFQPNKPVPCINFYSYEQTTILVLNHIFWVRPEGLSYLVESHYIIAAPHL